MGFARHIALLIGVLLALTSLCFAQNSKRSLADEQTFLYQIQNKQHKLIKNEDWKPFRSGQWELFIDDFIYNGNKEDVRFVSQKNLNKPTQYFLLVYKKDNAGEWVPRYGKKPDGIPQIVGTYDTGNDYISMYITPLNVKDKLDFAKIAYVNDVDPMKKQIYQDMMITLKDKDIHHRDLLRQISGLSMPTKTTVTREEYPWMDEKIVDQDGLIKQISTNIVYGAAYGLAGLKISYEGKRGIEQLPAFLKSSNNGLTSVTLNDASYKRITEEIIKNADYINSRPFIDIDQEVGEFNKHVAAINSICQTLKKQNDTDIHEAVEQTPTYFVSPGNEYNLDSKVQRDGERFATIQQKYQALADQGAKVHLDYISSQTPLALFWSSKTFTEAAKKFSPQGCIKEGSAHLNLITGPNVGAGIREVRENFITSINKQIEIIQSKRNTYGGKTLKTMIRSSPLAVHTAILQRNVVSEVLFAAQNVKEIYQKDQFNVYVDHTLMAAGFAAGIVAGAFSGGTLGAAIFYVMLTVDAVSLARGGTQWYDAYFLDQKIRQSMAAGQIGQTEGVEALDQNQTDLKAGKAATLMTLGGNAAGYGIGKGILAYSKAGTKTTAVVKKEAVGAVSRAEQSTAKSANQATEAALDPAPNTTSVESKTSPAMGKKIPAKNTSDENLESSLEQQKVKEKLGSKVMVLHAEGEKGLIRNEDGQLQEIFIHKGEIDFENIVQSKKIGNIEWRQDGSSIVKTTSFENGTMVTVMEDTKLIQVSFEDGTKIVSKYDSKLDNYLSPFVTSTSDEGLKISKGFVYRADQRVILIQNDGTVLQGKRVGSDIVFSNQQHEEYFSVADQKIFEVENQRWGKPSHWKRVTMDGETSDIAGFDIPTLKIDGLPSGYGDINCSGMAFSGDAWLSKKAPLSSALPDAHYRDIDFSLDLKDIIENSPTITSQNAAKHYHSVNETFNDYISVQNRLAKMEEGGTALVYVKNQDGTAHVLNVKKENGQVIYYDFQARSVSTDAQAQFFHNGNHPIEIIETTKYHQAATQFGIHPSVTEVEKILKLKGNPLQEKITFSSDKHGDIVEIIGVPQTATNYRYKEDEIFRQYIVNTETTQMIVNSQQLKPGALPYVVIHPRVKKEYYNNLHGTFLTKPSFSPREVGLENLHNMDYVDFTLPQGLGVIQLEPGIFLIPGNPSIQPWILQEYKKVNTIVDYKSSYEEILKKLEPYLEQPVVPISIYVHEYRRAGQIIH